MREVREHHMYKQMRVWMRKKEMWGAKWNWIDYANPIQAIGPSGRTKMRSARQGYTRTKPQRGETKKRCGDKDSQKRENTGETMPENTPIRGRETTVETCRLLGG